MDPIKTDVAVLGAGPGGYAAAFYAADKGKKVILIEKEKRLGGVCLNCGCIPSKALLHATEILNEAKHSATRGITFGDPKVELQKLRAWKDSIVQKLSDGIAAIASKRYRHVLAGNAADVIGRDHGGVAKRLFHHAGQVVECFSDVWFNYEFVMLRAKLFCDRASIRSFVEVLLSKTNGERLDGRTTRASH